MEQTVKISVRNLVEFIMRSGDIDNTRGSGVDTDAMQQGSRIHRKIQRSMGSNYDAEVPLSITVPVERDGISFELCVEGRADGILHEEESTIIDEIKGIYMDLDYLEEPVGVHMAQAMCYAYIYAKKQDLKEIGVRLTYCNLETEHIKYFDKEYLFEELKIWFKKLVDEYAKWACWQCKWAETRNQTIKQLKFPFSFRPGQNDLTKGVYRSILREKRLYIEAPTGVGKTISTVFPAVKAMGEGITGKIFYLTAKTITRTVAEDTVKLLIDKGTALKAVTITAKEKICVLDQCDCNPKVCERAKGHFDRVNDAVFDLLTSENQISRELILEYAKKHNVCPFEMSLDVTTWADMIICDYNYVFDPNVYLKRFFASEKKNDYVFLIDEAHNLVERAREMYSAILYKEDFLEVRNLVKGFSKKMEKKLSNCNLDLLKLKRECEEFEVVSGIQDLALHLLGLMAEYEEFLKEFPSFDKREKVLNLYFDIRHFLNIYDLLDEKYIIYTDYDEEDNFRIKLQCMDPSSNIRNCINRGRSAIFFSATLLPIRYYKEQLGGEEDDYAVYAPSPFKPEQRLLMIGQDVSTLYNRRNKQEFEKIADYINRFTDGKMGNYFVFFPSYQMMNQVAECMHLSEEKELYIQLANMTEMEKEEFLSYFQENLPVTRIGFCVMGGIFGEGIDLKGDRLIGAVIVGTGLPMVCHERELFRGYYEEKNHLGFEYAYLYHGMNKVLQSAGRVIRTDKDKGAILLLDERFGKRQYMELFPREWFPNQFVNRQSMTGLLEHFWMDES